MSAQYSVSLEKIIKDNGFEVLYMPRAADELYVASKEVHRPGLLLAGYVIRAIAEKTERR